MIKHRREPGQKGRLACIAGIVALSCMTFTRATTEKDNQQATNLHSNRPASEQRVVEIQVRLIGPRLVKESDIRTNIHMRVGATLDRSAVDDEVRVLYATGLFYNVRVTDEAAASGRKLVYLVQCNPRLVEVRFQGNTRFNDAELTKLISSSPGGIFNERTSFLDCQKIQAEYERAGAKGTTVKYTFESDEASGTTRLAFAINEKR